MFCPFTSFGAQGSLNAKCCNKILGNCAGGDDTFRCVPEDTRANKDWTLRMNGFRFRLQGYLLAFNERRRRNINTRTSRTQLDNDTRGIHATALKIQVIAKGEIQMREGSNLARARFYHVASMGIYDSG